MNSLRFRPACLAGCALIALAAAAGDSGELASRIARDTYLVRGEFPEGSQPDGNSILLLAPQGLVVIDSGRHVAHTQRLIDFARAQRRGVAAVINTHWHLDHIGGNVLLRDAFPAVTIYASDAFTAARQGFLRDYRAQLAQAIAQAQPTDDTASWRAEQRLIDAADRLAPDRIVTATQTLQIAGRTLQLHLEQRAVTAGDLWIEDPATQTLFAGDLVTLPVPFFDTACPAQWTLALGHIAERRFTTLVPGHGPPLTRSQFDVYRSAFTNLLTCTSRPEPVPAEAAAHGDVLQRAPMTCAEGWIQDLGPLLASDSRKRVGPMLDFYSNTVLRSPARNASCN